MGDPQKFDFFRVVDGSLGVDNDVLASTFQLLVLCFDILLDFLTENLGDLKTHGIVKFVLDLLRKLLGFKVVFNCLGHALLALFFGFVVGFYQSCDYACQVV